MMNFIPNVTFHKQLKARFEISENLIIKLLSRVIITILFFRKSDKLEYQEHRADVEVVCANGSIVVSLEFIYTIFINHIKAKND